MHPKAYNRLKTLSEDFDKPSEALRLMGDFMSTTLAHTKANSVKDCIEKFVRTSVVLKDVEDAANSLTKKMGSAH